MIQWKVQGLLLEPALVQVSRGDQISDRYLAKALQRGAASWLSWEAYTYRVCRAGRTPYHQYAHLRSGLVLGVRSTCACLLIECLMLIVEIRL